MFNIFIRDKKPKPKHYVEFRMKWDQLEWLRNNLNDINPGDSLTIYADEPDNVEVKIKFNPPKVLEVKKIKIHEKDAD